MIEGRLIVCIASSWDYDPTSKHHLMRVLSRRNDILWINYHGSRRPGLNRTDVRDSLGALKRVLRGLSPVRPSITQLTPMVIPGARNPWMQRLHRRLVVMQLRRAVRRVLGDRRLPIQIWSFAPDVPYLVGTLNEERFVYYCVDEFTKFDGYDAGYIAAAEDEMLDKADVVIASSQELLESRKQRRNDIELVRHGVEYDHFATAWRRRQPRPADLASIPRPIFGFFGLIHHWIDLKLLADVARRRPQYSFVMLGDCKTDISSLRGVNNVYLLGRKPYAELPAYCGAFDAAMMLFARNEMTANVNPVKMHEYLAAGLRIVSTELPEARRYEGPILFANDAQQFADACDRVLVNDQNMDRETISHLVAAEDWNMKVAQVSDIVMSRKAATLQWASKPIQDVIPHSAKQQDAIVAPT